MFDPKELKREFPIFKNHPNLVYLDNAATTQKPQSVIEAEEAFYTNQNSNVHRGIYPLSEEATNAYEAARVATAKFINADPTEIVFTSGTTDSINGLARSLELSHLLRNQPTILLTLLEHHANLLPWQRIGENRKLEFIPLDKKFKLDLNEIENITNEIDLLAVTHLSNVTGTLNEVSNILKIFAAKFSVIDAAQSIAHIPIDVKTWNADFIAFSGHKMYAPTGIGVLYGKRSLLDKMEPFRVGGGIVSEVNRESASWAEVPTKFEAGTPPIAQAIGLAAAIKFLSQLGWESIQHHEQTLRLYALERLQSISGIEIFHPPAAEVHGGIVSFALSGIHAHDIVQILAEDNICVRAGHHCTHVLHKEVLKQPGSVRISFGVYNSEEDIDKLIDSLKKVQQMFGN
ncbi:MAG: SufS family cysteine desulfurase [Candidatus Doudnabacteria bacterium]|nr:SufS family cysteine desulfurase [Candidatus Doudnabacteria bacterium]